MQFAAFGNSDRSAAALRHMGIDQRAAWADWQQGSTQAPALSVKAQLLGATLYHTWGRGGTGGEGHDAHRTLFVVGLTCK